MNNYLFNKSQHVSASPKLFLLFLILISLSFFANAQADGLAREGFYVPPSSSYGSSKPIAITITMDDGISLKAMVYYPTLDNGTLANEKFPVVIEMTPYPDRNDPAPYIANFNKNGYIFLIVRPRGTGGSEGEIQQFSLRDGIDGKNVAYWAAQQLKGSNGSVGLFGCSYPGAIALAAAAVKDKNSPIKAVIAACIGLDMQYRQVWTTNGLPNGALAAYVPNAKYIMGNYPSINKYWSKFYDNLLVGGAEAYDGYWKDRLPLSWAKNIVENKIPVLLWGGWKDINETGAVHAYVAFQNASNGKDVYQPMSENINASARYQLVMGDWAHGQGLEPLIFIQWFDTWIKGLKTGMEATKNPLHIYEIGSERWINTDRYPLVHQYNLYYFNSNKILTTSKSLTAGTEFINYAKPNQSGGKIEFTTPIFSAGITLAGPMSVTLYASTSNTNLVFIAKIIDVSPEGDSTIINYGAVVGSLRKLDIDRSWKDQNGTIIWPWPKLDKDIYLRPDKVYRFDISLATRLYAVKPGHKLVLQLTSQSPENICPDNGNVPFTSQPCGLTKPQQETLPGGKYIIYFGGKYQSALNLPVLPYNHFKEVKKGSPKHDTENNNQNISAGKFTLPMTWQ